MEEPKPIIKYVGGKRRVAESIMRHFPSDIDTVYSPFVGGGAVEMIVANSGKNVVCNDIDASLIRYYRCIQNPSRRLELAQEVRSRMPITKEKHFDAKTKMNLEDGAPSYFIANLASFQGLTYSGFSKEGAERIARKLNALEMDGMEYLSRMVFHNMDYADFFRDVIPHDAFVFLDPPYAMSNPRNNRLYGPNGVYHKHFDHEKLRDILRKRRQRFVMCYNESDAVRKLYEDWCTIIPLGVGGKEVLIISTG